MSTELVQLVDDNFEPEFVMEAITLANGRLFFVHPAAQCERDPSCCVHKPSMHPLRDAPYNWRWDVYPPFMERICVHGCGHPDPDDLAYKRSIGEELNGIDIHGCDGCCVRWSEVPSD